MRKAYIQPEAELISLASLEDFLDTASKDGDGTGSDWEGNEEIDQGGNEYQPVDPFA